MLVQADIRLPTDIMFNGKSYFDIEYPYTSKPIPIESSSVRLNHTYEFQRQIAAQHCRLPNFMRDSVVWGGGCPMSGAMGFLVAQDAEAKVLWYVTLDEGNPICEVRISERIVANTSSGYQIVIEALSSKTVNIEITRPQQT